jgi:hypothetical protein
MQHEAQVETLRSLLRLREEERHQGMLGQIAQVPVCNYTDHGILEHEMASVFRDYPTVAGHAFHVREHRLRS